MGVLIVYDSVYGNTEKIARAIGSAIDGEVKLVRVNEANLTDLNSVEMLIVGSPTQGGRPTKAIQSFIDNIPEDAVKGVKLLTFDTRFSNKLVGIFGNAASRIANVLKTRGANLVLPAEGFFVKGEKGPLKDGEIDRAASWAKKFSGSLK
jgi:flavodoxin I